MSNIKYLIYITTKDTRQIQKPQTDLFHCSSFHQSVVSEVQCRLRALLFSQTTSTGRDLHSLEEASDTSPSVAYLFDCNVIRDNIKHHYTSIFSQQNIGVWTFRHKDTSALVLKCPSDILAPVPKCLGHFGTDHRGSHACQWRQLRSGRGGELKAVDVYVPLSLNCGF